MAAIKTDAQAGLARILEATRLFENAVQRCCREKRFATVTLMIRNEGGRVSYADSKIHEIHHGDQQARTDLGANEENT